MLSAASVNKVKELGSKLSRYVQVAGILKLEGYLANAETLTDEVPGEVDKDGPAVRAQLYSKQEMEIAVEKLSLSDQIHLVKPLPDYEHVANGVPELTFSNLMQGLYDNGYRLPEIYIQCLCGRILNFQGPVTARDQLDRIKMDSKEEDSEYFTGMGEKFKNKTQVEMNFQSQKLDGYGDKARGKMKQTLGKLNATQEAKWRTLNTHLMAFHKRRIAINAQLLGGALATEENGYAWIECSALQRAKVIENDHVKAQALIIEALTILVQLFMEEEDEIEMEKLLLEIEAEMKNLFSPDKIRITHRVCHETADRPKDAFPNNVHPDKLNLSFEARTIK
ncbi:hypothetical protein BV898_03356 [Hypsibius exemplaris]|uniref:Uncharacterized protein n=1 Tax=Hypsibius exemplaris TaxID=2072580 RepID=A0A1W0X6E7_HYPEX|nr:hypothetical protein BV898_03356 [Hypsibius exemplaris]